MRKHKTMKAEQWQNGCLKGGNSVKATILEQLFKFRLNHSKPYSADELEILCDDWYDALSDEKIDMILFQNACMQLRKTSTYFPTIADVIEKCKELTQKPRLDWKDPADDIDPADMPSPEQVAENIKRIKEICRKNAEKYKMIYMKGEN